jgi:glycosyltransferase involved in cell wall biosynthesis
MICRERKDWLYGSESLWETTCGLPSIVTGNAGSLVRSGIDGYLVEPGNIPAIVDALEQIRSNPRRAIEMGRNARQRIDLYLV